MASATTAYRYNGFKESDARALDGRIATITTHSDPENDPDGIECGATFGPNYVRYVAGKSYVMLLPATHQDGDQLAPERIVGLIEVATVTVHEPAAGAPGRRQVVDGWDGNSQPMIALVDPCGCKWTADGSARLSVCTPCLTRACAD